MYSKSLCSLSDAELLELRNRCYKSSCRRGFHDGELDGSVVLSDFHYLMLIISEVSELVDADRRNNYASREFYDASCDYFGKVPFLEGAFENHIKDSVEDELADVVIRIFDFCGARSIEPWVLDTMREDFDVIFGGKSICEQCYFLCQLLAVADEDFALDDLAETLSCALTYCACFAECHGIDLLWHIEQKIQYNETRPRLNGKKY